MIAGAVRGRGEPQFVDYLLSSAAGQLVRLGGSRQLLGKSLHARMGELRARATRGRSTAPLLHCWASPDPAGPAWTEADWARWWKSYEAEFGLEDQPWTEVIHIKGGREHRHRVYLLIQRDGTCINLSHQAPRHEYLSRLVEHQTGARLIQGLHNRAVAARLQRDGQDHVANAMEAAGLLSAPLRRGYSRRERQQALRSGIRIDDLARAVFRAWRRTSLDTSGKETFRITLARRGLQVGAGSRATYVVWAEIGGRWNLLTLLARGLRRAGLDPANASLAAVREMLEAVAPSSSPAPSTEVGLHEDRRGIRTPKQEQRADRDFHPRTFIMDADEQGSFDRPGWDRQVEPSKPHDDDETIIPDAPSP